ncbi:MAG: hypothetical protein J6Y70_01245 [Bacilli bacterium]|nr:hypothetical protein [Bacilli bacterium]
MKKILILCLVFVSIFLYSKYRDICSYDQKKIDLEKKIKDSEEEKDIFWYFVFGILIIYVVFLFSKSVRKLKIPI